MRKPSNIAAALDALGIAYTVKGDEAQANCPAHKDFHPSWSCNLTTGMHNCFSCGFSGSFVRLVTHLRGCSQREAADWCSGFQREWDQVRVTVLPDAPAVRPVRQYSEADLALFIPPPDWALDERNLTAEACAAYGVLFDLDEEAWILPIRDPETGKLWGWQEKSEHHFRNRPHGVRKAQTLFGYQTLAEGATAILVESPLDAARIWAAGIPGAVASFGVEVSETQLDLIVDRCARLIVALDDDDAGDKRCAQLRRFTRIPVRFFDYADSGAKDPGEMTDSQIRHGVEHAIPGHQV